MSAASPANVSVIVPTKNRSTLLRQALASIRSVEAPDLRLEIIVADNGSTDDTFQVAQAFGARLVQTLTPGPSAARNCGVRAATGEYLAFLDDDDLWTTNHIRPQIELLRAQPSFDAAIGQIVLTDTSRNPLGPPYPAQLDSSGWVFLDFLQHWPQIGALVTRATVPNSVGFFDEGLLGAEDWDWHLRLARRHRIALIQQPCLLFRVRPPADDGEYDPTMLRSTCNRHVFWKNVRETNAYLSHPWLVARTQIRYNGAFTGYLLNHATAHCEHARYDLARGALINAFRTSPAHVIWALLTRPAVRRSVASMILHRRQLSSSPSAHSAHSDHLS